MEQLSEVGMQFQGDDGDFDRQLEKEAREKRERTGEDEKIAWQMIRNEKRAIKKILTERQYIAFCYFTYEDMSKVDIAKEMGITEGAVRKLLKKAELVVEDAYQKEIIL